MASRRARLELSVGGEKPGDEKVGPQVEVRNPSPRPVRVEAVFVEFHNPAHPGLGVRAWCWEVSPFDVPPGGGCRLPLGSAAGPGVPSGVSARAVLVASNGAEFASSEWA